MDVKRRAFLEKAARGDLREVGILPVEQKGDGVSKFANKVLPTVERTTAGLEPYVGPWGFDQAAHLLRRTMFGATRADIQAMTGLPMDQAVAQLLADSAAPSPPVRLG